jgi:hypothetical protein
MKKPPLQVRIAELSVRADYLELVANLAISDELKRRHRKRATCIRRALSGLEVSPEHRETVRQADTQRQSKASGRGGFEVVLELEVQRGV